MIEATPILLKRKYRTGKRYKSQASAAGTGQAKKRIVSQLDKHQLAERHALNVASLERAEHRVLVLENGAARLRWV